MKRFLPFAAALAAVACGPTPCLGDGEQARLIRKADAHPSDGARPTVAYINIKTREGHRVCGVYKDTADALREGEIVVGPLAYSDWRVQQ